jgi:Tol biopolymer transport system component
VIQSIEEAIRSSKLQASLGVLIVFSAGAMAEPFPRQLDPSGCVVEQITSSTAHNEYHVLGPSPDGKHFSMAARPVESTAEEANVYEMDLKTGKRTNHSHVLTNSGAYSPDGRFLVVAQMTERGKTDIFEYERATGELRAIAPHDDWDWLPSYSPDGKFIVFNSYRVDGQADIHLFEKSSRTLTRLSDDPGYDAHARFSPDGTQILYHRQQGTRDEGGYIFNLFVYDVDTGQTTQLTESGVETSYPAWAPDGRHIVHSSDINGTHGKHNLYVRTLNGETTSRLTQGDWKDSYSFWTLDGEFIYFNSDRAGVSNVYRILMDGLDCVREDG